MMISYAQNFEDVMLWRAMGHVEHGRYIDIGAQHPVIDSVSKAFYDSGWRGLHVEPTAYYSGLLRECRPEERVLAAAVGRGGVLTFYEFAETGLSTLDAAIAQQHIQNGFECTETVVPVVTLESILAEYSGDEDIHWLKIDVEGAEKAVIESWGDSPVRPWVLVIESTLPLSTVETHKEWEGIVLRKGYRHAYFDGLNRFYISNKHPELKRAFGAPPNVFDDFVVALDAGQPFAGALRQEAAEQRARFDDAERARKEADALRIAADNLRIDADKLRADAENRASMAEERLIAAEADNFRLEGSNRLLERELTATEERLRELEDALRTQVSACEAAEREAQLQLEQAENTESLLNAAYQTINQEQKRAADLEATLAAVRVSNSWRITAPARALYKGLRSETKAVILPFVLGPMKLAVGMPRTRKWFATVARRYPALDDRLRRLAINRGMLPAAGDGVERSDQVALVMTSHAERIYQQLKCYRDESR